MISINNTPKEIDAQLVARIREGDVSAFETIVERYRAVMIARANALVNSLADAEDIAQEAFVQAYFRIKELRNPEALSPWLRKVTERQALMYLRKRREEPVDSEYLETIATDHSDTTAVDSILTELPEGMREAVSLTFLAGYTCAEAAVILGVKEGTVKSRLNRARARLKEVLGMTERDIAAGQPTGDFTRRTIERLKREARRLVAEGKLDEASERANEVLNEQVKPLYGDPEKLGVATFLAACDSGAFKPDEEAVAMLGLPRKEQRRRECEANAAQYGFKLEDLDWELADVDMWCETLGKPAGHGRDIWGVPVSRMKLDIIDTRVLCQKLRVSPLTLWQWVKSGCPILRCWPFVMFDFDRVGGWLVEKNINDWPQENEYNLERPIRIVFREVYNGSLSTGQAEELMQDLGHGVWEAPMPGIKGGWQNGRS